MNRKDRVAFVISSIVVLFGLLIAVEGPEGLLLLPPVVLYWLYRYLNKDISFIPKQNDKGEQ